MEEERPRAIAVRAIPNTVRVSDVRTCDCLSTVDEVAYEDIINFSRSSIRSHHHCVMCGALKDQECIIPNQNKDVCKVCDSSFWYQKRLRVVVKFCKGKHFEFKIKKGVSNYVQDAKSFVHYQPSPKNLMRQSAANVASVDD